MSNVANMARLRVNGKLWEGWQAIEVTRSIEQMASTFTFESAARAPGGKDALRIQPGAACDVLLDDDVVLMGWVDALDLGHDATSHTIRVSGRSLTCDLVDCSAVWPTGGWKNVTAAQIINDLAGVYNVTTALSGGTASLPVFRLQDGETCSEAIDRLCRTQTMLAYDDATGSLVCGPVGTERGTDDLVVGTNLLSARLHIDVSKRYTEYRVKGQRASDETIDGVTASTASGTSEDEELTEGRSRVLVLHADGGATIRSCTERANWEAAYRAGKSIEVEVTVQGWRQSDGSLWDINKLRRVRDTTIGVDADLLTVEVAYTLSDAGTITRMRLAPACGFVPEPPFTIIKSTGKKKSTANDGFDPFARDDGGDE